MARSCGRKARLCITAWPVMLTGAGAAHPGFGRSASTEVQGFAMCSRSKSTLSGALSSRRAAGVIVRRPGNRCVCCRIGVSGRGCGSRSELVIPDEGQLRIELKGNLAAMLGAAQNARRSPETGDLSLQVVMVAGARNQHYLQLWRPAA